jgi:hypothetical protein
MRAFVNVNLATLFLEEQYEKQEDCAGEDRK